MLVVTSRDPGAPPVEYIKVSGGILKEMLIHDFDIFRWILGDEAATVYATGSCLTDPAVGTYYWTASYSGDANNAATSTACGDPGESSVVTKAHPALSTNAAGPVTLG